MITTGMRVDSPEGISFTYELASLADRAKAYGIDLLIRIAIVIVVGLFFAVALGPAILAGVGLWLILYFVIEWGYYVFFETLWDGQSPGRRLFDLRVVKVDGRPINFFDSLLRNLLRAADILPATYAAGAITMLVTHRFQRLGDLAAGTMVVVEQKAWYGLRQLTMPPPPGELLPRVVLSNRERRLLQEFILRRERLHPDRCEQLAQILADPYRKRFGPTLGPDAQRDSATAFLMRLHAAGSKERGA